MEAKYIGKKLGKDVNKEEIMKALKCTSTRVVYPDSMMTMDYIQTRVNICVNNSDVIERIYIG